MAERLNTAARNRQADSIGDDLNSGTFKLYTGSQPASGDDTASGTLLVTVNLPADAFAAAASGVAAKSGTWSGVAAASGDAGWGRFENSGATRNYDISVTATGGGGDLELDDIEIVSGQTVLINTFSITQPGG
jgi:hypothetical protein